MGVIRRVAEMGVAGGSVARCREVASGKNRAEQMVPDVPKDDVHRNHCRRRGNVKVASSHCVSMISMSSSSEKFESEGQSWCGCTSRRCLLKTKSLTGIDIAWLIWILLLEILDEIKIQDHHLLLHQTTVCYDLFYQVSLL